MCCTSTGTNTAWIQNYIAKLLFQEASNTCGLHLFMTIDLLDRIVNCLEKEVDNSSKWNSKSNSQYLLNHGPGRLHIGKCPADQLVPLSNNSLLLSTHLHSSLLSTHHSKTGGKDAIPAICQPQGIPAGQPWTNDKNGGSWSAYFFRLPPSLCPKNEGSAKHCCLSKLLQAIFGNLSWVWGRVVCPESSNSSQDEP